MLELARKCVWWKSPSDAMQWPYRVIAQVMELGDFDDVQALAGSWRPIAARRLRNAQAGQFRPRSWAYWHFRLGLGSASADRSRAQHTLDPRIEAVIAEVIENWLPKQQALAAPMRDLTTEIEGRCRQANLKAPGRNTVCSTVGRVQGRGRGGVGRAGAIPARPGQLRGFPSTGDGPSRPYPGRRVRAGSALSQSGQAPVDLAGTLRMRWGRIVRTVLIYKGFRRTVHRSAGVSPAARRAADRGFQPQAAAARTPVLACELRAMDTARGRYRR